MLNHLICPRCADKLTEIAMIHQMVHDSNNFFKRQQQMPAGSSQNNRIQISDQINRPKRFDTGNHPRSSPFIPRHREAEPSINQRNNTDWFQFNGPLEVSDSEDEGDVYNNSGKSGRTSFIRNGRKL